MAKEHTADIIFSSIKLFIHSFIFFIFLSSKYLKQQKFCIKTLMVTVINKSASIRNTFSTIQIFKLYLLSAFVFAYSRFQVNKSSFFATVSNFLGFLGGMYLFFFMHCHVLSFSFVLFIFLHYHVPSGLSQFEINLN